MVVVMSKAGTCVTKVLDESPSSMGTLCNMNSIPDFSSPEVVDEEVEAGPQNTAVSRWLRGNDLMLAEVMHLTQVYVAMRYVTVGLPPYQTGYCM